MKAVDELAVRKVAKLRHLPEDVIRTIVRLRNQGLGFRRISKRVRETHSYELGKDKTREVLLKYDELARPTELPPDRELERLTLKLEEEKREKELREEVQRREEEKCRMRKELFLLRLENEGNKLIKRVIERRLSKENPGLYERFKKFCGQYNYTAKQAVEYLCDADGISYYVDEFYEGDVPEIVELASWVEIILEDTLKLGVSSKTLLFIKRYGPFWCPECGRDMVLRTRSEKGDVIGCPWLHNPPFRVGCPSCQAPMKAIEGKSKVKCFPYWTPTEYVLEEFEVVSLECPKCKLSWEKLSSQEWPPRYVYAVEK
jgi:predicted RNA-binding Zn-ribbon protein involved in translation (DUF1610 family)